MGLLHRRFPRYGRPVPFATCLLLALVGFYWGLNWEWDWSLQTGNIFLLILIPRDLVTFEGGRALLLIVGFASLIQLYAWGTTHEAAARRLLSPGTPRWQVPRFRFYPLVAALGLFLLYFGLVFLFDASVYGDQAPGGFVAFIYLDYAGLFDRPFMTLVGMSVATAGFLAMTRYSFAFTTGIDSAPTAPPQSNEATPESEARPHVPLGVPAARPPPTRTTILPRKTAPTIHRRITTRTARSVLMDVPAGLTSRAPPVRPPVRTVGPVPRPRARPPTGRAP